MKIQIRWVLGVLAGLFVVLLICVLARLIATVPQITSTTVGPIPSRTLASNPTEPPIAQATQNLSLPSFTAEPLVPSQFTVTPPRPGEPTLPPQALAMHAAPIATPSPIPPSPTPTPTASPTVTPIAVTSLDDVPMVQVPAGEFIMGSTDEQLVQWEEQNRDFFRAVGTGFIFNQYPQLVIRLESFTIDKLEVTVSRYRRCVDAGICHPVESLNTLSDDYPVIGVTWYDADAYCRWVGKRLPNEAEWEKAARGTDGRWYPWGNEWDDKRANDVKAVEQLRPVGSYLEGASPYGALDMGGNAYEWVADQYAPYPGQPLTTLFLDADFQKRVVRGRNIGLRGTMDPGAATTNRMGAFPDRLTPGNSIGFRCAQGPVQDWRSKVISTSLPPLPPTLVPATPDVTRMAYVPAGEFIMGIDTEIDPRSSPAHVVYLDAFYIDRYEVTVTDYVAFLNARGSNNCDQYACVHQYQGKVAAQWIDTSNGSYWAQLGFEDRPVVEVTWWGAQAYCRWQGKRLPTEAEWEKAARGTDGRLYPWGNEWDSTRAAVQPSDMFQGGVYPLAVGTHPGDVSPYGVYDMLGNAAEWVADWYSESYYAHSPYANPLNPGGDRDYGRVVRGRPGGRERQGVVIRDFGNYGSFIGFRCVYRP